MTCDDPPSVAEYAASVCVELAALAKDDGFDMGAYLLQMACTEFQTQWLQLAERAEARESAG